MKIQPPSPREPRVSCGTSQRGPTAARTTGARTRMRSGRWCPDGATRRTPCRQAAESYGSRHRDRSRSGRSRRLHSRSSSGSGIAFESSGAPCAGRRSAPGPLAGHPRRRYPERNERTVATCRCQVRGQVAPRFRGLFHPHPNGQRPESGRHADQGGVQPSARGPALPGAQIHVFMVVAGGSVGRRMRWARSPGVGAMAPSRRLALRVTTKPAVPSSRPKDRSCSRSWPG